MEQQKEKNSIDRPDSIVIEPTIDWSSPIEIYIKNQLEQSKHESFKTIDLDQKSITNTHSSVVPVHEGIYSDTP